MQKLPSSCFRILIATSLTILPGVVSMAVASPESDAGFRVFEARCFQCHGGAVSLSGLNLGNREAALKGGSRGAAVQPGQAAGSLLYQVVSHAKAPAMPPTGKLADEEIEALRKWIDAGFEWPANAAAPVKSDWWAFRKPVRPPAPPASKGESVIDAFVDAVLKKQNLPASPEADRLTLLRRAYMDLHGLPPTPKEVDEFLGDKSPEAWEKLIDRLLESPRYGEKWGRHWLDLVRYGDTAGFETDPYHLDAWRYRDYVIESFNNDKPYNQFIKEQLAGEELWPEDPAAVTATGLFRVGPHRDLQVKVEEENRIEKLSDYVETTSGVFLGLTLGCARCHDHKFDPLPQRDFYRMQAIFEPAVNKKHMLQPLALLSSVNETKREFRLWQLGKYLSQIYEPYEKELRDKQPEGERRRRISEEELRAAMSPADRERLASVERELVKIFRGYGPPPFVDGIGDASARWQPSFVAERGNPQNPGEEVKPGFPSVLGGGDIPEPGPRAASTGRRTAFAEWLTSPDNPLTARVMVNRIWQYHFGRGLVRTSSDFGVRAGKPSHPELLDWLALEFIDRGWSIKAMHRLMMNTKVYRRSSVPTAVAREKDPENIYLARMSRRRLSAEEVRDSVLLVSGRLNLEMGGQPVVHPLDEEELYGIIGRPDEAWPVTPDSKQHTRRSVYVLARRTFVQPMFAAFDKPDGVGSCPQRNESTTAPQSLTLLNSRFMVEQANHLAATHPELDAMWRQVLGRTPKPQEKQWAEEFLEQQARNQGSMETARAELARALLNLNEFLYVD